MLITLTGSAILAHSAVVTALLSALAIQPLWFTRNHIIKVVAFDRRLCM